MKRMNKLLGSALLVVSQIFTLNILAQAQQQQQPDESWKHFYAVISSGNPADHVKYTRQMGYGSIGIKSSLQQSYRNNSDTKGMRFVLIDPEWMSSTYLANGVDNLPSGGNYQNQTRPAILSPRQVNQKTAYTQDQKDWYLRNMLWYTDTNTVPWYKNLASSGFTTNGVSLAWDFQQQRVIDMLVNYFVNFANNSENQNNDFLCGGFYIDELRINGILYAVPNYYILPSTNKNASSAAKADFMIFLSQVSKSGTDSGVVPPVVDEKGKPITHEYATYTEGVAAFYKTLNAKMKQNFPNAKWIGEPARLYNVYDPNQPWTMDEWVNKVWQRWDKDLLTPDLLTEEGPTTAFVDDFNNSMRAPAFASMNITKDMVGSQQASVVQEELNRLIAAKAGINGAWFNWSLRFGGARTLPNWQDIMQVYPRMKLIRVIPNWDNLNKIPLANRKCDECSKVKVGVNGGAVTIINNIPPFGVYTPDSIVYKSTDINGSIQSYIDKDVMYSRHPGTISPANKGKLFAVFNTINGVINLKPGETVLSTQRVDNYFIETGDGSADVDIVGNTIKLKSGVNIPVDSSNLAVTITPQIEGVGYIFTLSQSAPVTSPTVTTASATNQTSTSATLNGSVNPNGADTTVNFKYGTTSGLYAGQINANPNSISASSGNTLVGANLTGLASNTTYYYRVVATNSAGTTNGSEMSFTTSDSSAPSVPQNLVATAISSSKINLSWNASTDNVGVAGYRIYRGTTLIASVTSGTTYSNTGLLANTSYSYTVLAYDAAGNSSSQSSSVSITTLSAADTTAPVISNISSSGITYNSATITWTTNENSDSQLEYGPTTSYGQTTTLNSALVISHTVNLPGLSTNTVYHYRVKSRDAVGNLAISSDYTFTTNTTVSGNVITINPQITYQTMIGWEAAADLALDNRQGVDPAKYKDELLDLVVNDIGINQIQLGILPSAENSVDYWSQYQNSPKAQSDYDTWRANRQTTVNDDNDPNNINWNGFQFSKLDYEMDTIIVPLRQLLTVKGEQLHFNLRYVAYTNQSTGVPVGQKYDHDDPQEYAEFMLTVFLHLRNKYGFVPDALTIINEPDNFATREWVQQGARGTLIGRAIVAVGNKLKQNGFSPRILAPETISIANASSADYFDKMINISGVSQYLSEITYHRYVTSGNPDADLQAIVNKAAQYGLDTGMHEWWNPSNSYKTLHKDIKMGKNSSWQQGTLAGLKSLNSPLYGTTPLYTIDDTDINNPTLLITPMTKFTRQYYKFIRNGAIRIDAASNNTNFDPVAFVNTNGKHVVVVNANTGGTFSIKNLPAGNYGIKYTTLNQYDIDLTDQDISSGQALATNIPAAGVITIYEKTIQSTDNTKPIGSITINGTAVTTGSSNVTLNLSATDNVGVTGYYVSESSTTPTATQTGWVSVTPVTNYLASISYTLSSGDGLKTLYGWYKDGFDNISNITSDSIRLDTSLPSINIMIPTSNAIYNTTNSTISLGGIAADNNSSGIQSLAWYSNRGGNGTITGGANWTIGNISLLSGNNIITVTARDNAGNINNDTITVGYTQLTAPVAITGSSFNVTYNTSTLSASVNAGGLQTTAYFEYGANAGYYSFQTSNQIIIGSNNTTIAANVSGLSLNTTYYYRVVAANSAGTTNGNDLSFTTAAALDTSAPSGSISRGGKYTKLRNVPLTLSATDNIGVSGYYLSENNTTPLAQDPGWVLVNPATTTYSAYVFYLLSAGDGVKTVYVWYKDVAGNISSAASDTIILDTTAPSISITIPTANATYTTTSSTIELGGTVSDITSGIRSVSWNNNQGGSGTAIVSATDWSVSGIALAEGYNLITLTALDMVGAIASDTVTVTYNAASLDPSVTTLAAANISTSSATLNGTVNANGLTATAYFEYSITQSLTNPQRTDNQIITGTSVAAISAAIIGLSANTTYYYRLTANNSAGTAYGNQMSFTTAVVSDTIAPVGNILINGGANYTNTSAVTLRLSATDNVGVSGYYVAANATIPSLNATGWTQVTTTANYTANSSYTLTTGDGSKAVYCWYRDAAGRISSTASDSIMLDTILPAVTITSPTSNAAYTTTNTAIPLSGSASGASSILWSNNRGGSGTAAGTSSWSIASISLYSGENIITITAKDTAGNQGTDTLTVTCTAAIPPTATTGTSSNITSSSATVSGTVNSNGAETNVWFEVGTSSDWYAFSVPAQIIGATAATTTVSVGLTDLAEGITYYYRVAAENSVGISYGAQKNFTTKDAIAPGGSISINFDERPTNSQNVILILYATDNVGVRGYYISTSSALPLATASGWIPIDSSPEYYIEISYSLSAGDGHKTVYCWYKDGAGNVSSAASDTIILDTAGPAVRITLPTSNTSYSTRSEVIGLQGTASDALSQLSSIGLVNSRGGEGFIEVSEDWQIPWVYLVPGENIITVTATDMVGNTNKDSITITYTPPNAPAVTTEGYSNVTGSSATISGTVNPDGAETNVWFEVGTTSGWCMFSVPAQTLAATAATTTVSVDLSELSEGTTYYYRIVAINNAGMSYGPEKSFATKNIL